MRPRLRRYEIPYLCGSTTNKEFRIDVNDLLVGIKGNKILLFSKRLNKEVIPRLTTAHNYNLTTVPVYKFLCDLQFQNIRTIGWQWGGLEALPFLPRVSYGRFIFSKARWRLTKEDMSGTGKKTDAELLERFRLVKKEKGLPDYVVISQGDNELLLHLDNIFCIKLLVAELNKTEFVLVTESLEAPDTCWIKSPEGSHTGEFIFTFNKIMAGEVRKIPLVRERQIGKKVQRFFPVGSEWLYAKIYCGPRTAENILTGVIKTLTEELLSKKIIDKYFFVRYNDNEHHIRIRFHNPNGEEFWKDIILLLKERLQPFMAAQQVYNVKFETYQREIERYGFRTVELSEDIFFHQSTAVLNFILMLRGDEGEQTRWQAGVKAIDLFLNAFGYSIQQKRTLLKALDKNFGNEFNIGSTERKRISEQFSRHKQLLQRMMSNNWEDGDNLHQAISFFEIRNNNYQRCIGEIVSRVSSKDDRAKIDSLISSYLHMFINRLFVNNQRKTEMIIYDYLFRFYDSCIAKEQRIEAILKT